ncbi:alpha/beta fold hydrolase [Nonomuraea sp. NPDC048892]|uniref:alpha/beta hydrolase family protein n=1 Tax=Nonomuraea sp. NPDC048892 TaxID=3154624 RepID=UPI0033ED5AE8
MGDACAVAVRVAQLARDGRFAEVVELFEPPLRAVVSEQALQVAWEAEVGKRGSVSALGEPVGQPAGAGLMQVSVPIVCGDGVLALVMAVDDAGRLHGLRLAPGTTSVWAPPAYAVPQRFTERDVMIGSGPLAVPGTLTLPHSAAQTPGAGQTPSAGRGSGPARTPGAEQTPGTGHTPDGGRASGPGQTSGTGQAPGVVLLSGGGPFDRDETSGPNKPLKDLAWGLASRGVAALRFDKVTYAHVQAADAPDFTMTDEYVPHAVAAVRLLQSQDGVDPERIFVVGHSMGGKVAPRVAAADASIRGLVILAGDTQPMHHAAVRVTRHLASLSPGPAAEAMVEGMVRLAATVDSPDLSPSTPSEALPFGLSATYWLDLRDYDPVATAVALDKPMFILQGGRDYQVTVADDLSGWKAGLGHRPDVTIRVYDADDHLFFPGDGPSTPADYESPQHVDPLVIGDIAAWVSAA